MKAGEHLVHIPIDSIELEGFLSIPQSTKGIVIFAHGSGSSRLSPRNNFVARVLRDHSIGTLLFDLLIEEEDAVYENRFDIALLTKRLIAATQWLMKQPEAKWLKIGYFGSSTGTASALYAAAKLGDRISAVVSRGGRPDLAMAALPQVKSPTLLIVGGDDEPVIKMNQEAYKILKTKKEIKIISGATHLFEETGALEEVARVAAEWFAKYLQ